MSDELSDMPDGSDSETRLEPQPPNEVSTDVGTEDETQVDTEVDDGATASEEGSLDENVVDGKGTEVDEGEEDDDTGKKIAAILCILCCLLCCVVIGLLAFFLTPETEPLGRSQTDPFTDSPTPLTLSPTTATPTTLAPTDAPTENPTPDGATSRPTENPTLNPTPAPTLPDFEPPTNRFSRLPCDEIRKTENATAGNFGDNNFKSEFVNGTEVCGDTYGPDPNRPNRNPWSVSIGRRDCDRYSFEEGLAICDVVGARWCTVQEFVAGVAQGTGCGGDREMVYTDSDCIVPGSPPDAPPGKIMFDVGLRDKRAPFYECEGDLTRKSLARCCGDAVIPDQ